MDILHGRTLKSKSFKPPPRIRCANCDAGTVAAPGECCAGCWATYHRESDIRAAHRRTDIINRLSAAAGCKPDELVEALLPELAAGVAQIVAAVVAERGRA